MQFRITGIERETGRRVEFILDAADEAAVRVEADRRGIRDSRIERGEAPDPAESAAPPDPLRAPSQAEPVLVRMEPGYVQTIQLTGKGWKGLMAFALVLFLAGMAVSGWLVMGSPRQLSHPSVLLVISLLTSGIGMVLLLVARLGAWWHHG